MTILRVKPSGWGLNEVLTSAQQNALDTNVTKALDKTAAGDTLSGIVTVDAGGGFVFSGGGTDYLSGNFAIFESGAGPKMKNGSFITIDASATVNMQTASGYGTYQIAKEIVTRIQGPARFESTQTAIAAGSAGATLPTGTINVSSTTGFPASGTIFVLTLSGIQSVAYTGTTGTSFTGCTGGTGTMDLGAPVSAAFFLCDTPGEFVRPLILAGTTPIIIAPALSQGRWSQSTPYNEASTVQWTPAFNSGVLGWQNLGAVGKRLIWPLELPHGQTLTQVTCRLYGAQSDVALPANKPVLEVFYSPVATALLGCTSLGSATDSSGTLVAYQAIHAVTVSGLSHTIDRVNNYYFASITSESGTNSNPGTTVFGVAWVISRSTITG